MFAGIAVENVSLVPAFSRSAVDNHRWSSLVPLRREPGYRWRGVDPE